MLDLNKTTKFVLDLKKSVGLEGTLAAVTVVLDRSGSMHSLFFKGDVSNTLSRVLPLSMAFDDNGEIDLITFSSNASNRDPITPRMYTSGNLQEYVMRIGTSGSTNYADALHKVINMDYEVRREGGLFGIGAKEVYNRKENAPKCKRFVIFITDGDCDEDAITETKKLMEKINSKELDIFIKFLGLGNSSFGMLSSFQSAYPKVCDFFRVHPSWLSSSSDEEFYSQLLKGFTK